MSEVFRESVAGGEVIGTLSEDKVKLFIELKASDGAAMSVPAVLAAIGKHIDPERVNEGVVEDCVKKFNEGEDVKNRRVAKGAEPGPGRDGKLVYLVKLYTGKGSAEPGEGGEDSEVDIRELHLFDNIQKGQVIARIYPPAKGEDGEDAFGNLIEAQYGKPFKCSHDKTLGIINPEPGKSYERVRANTDGYLFEDGGRLSISEELSIGGDIDYRVGNLDFISNIIINGSVMRGFRVKAGQSVSISGEVQQASIIAESGDISISGPAFGSPGQKLEATGQIELYLAQELHAEALQEIHVKKEARDCILRSQMSIHLPEGELIGGKTHTVCGVEAKIIGNSAGLSTEIYLSNDLETTAEFTTMLRNIASHEEVEEMLKMQLGPLAENQERVQLLNEDHRRKIETLLKKLKEVQSSLQFLTQKRDTIMETGKRSTSTQVNILKKAYPGTKIIVGTEVMDLKEPIEGPKTILWLESKQKFGVTDLKPIECVLINTGVKKDDGEGSKTETDAEPAAGA